MVEFKGRLPWAEVVELMANCRAFLFPGFEDFVGTDPGYFDLSWNWLSEDNVLGNTTFDRLQDLFLCPGTDLSRIAGRLFGHRFLDRCGQRICQLVDRLELDDRGGRFRLGLQFFGDRLGRFGGDFAGGERKRPLGQGRDVVGGRDVADGGPALRQVEVESVPGAIQEVTDPSAGPPLVILYLKPPSSGGLWEGVMTTPSERPSFLSRL